MQAGGSQKTFIWKRTSEAFLVHNIELLSSRELLFCIMRRVPFVQRVYDPSV
jgi:hypothetical protein